MYGAGTGRLPELRFLSPNVEIQAGDRLVTSGIDGTYPVNNAAPYPGPTVLNLDHNEAEWVGGELQVSRTLWESQRLTSMTPCMSSRCPIDRPSTPPRCQDEPHRRRRDTATISLDDATKQSPHSRPTPRRVGVE